MDDSTAGGHRSRRSHLSGNCDWEAGRRKCEGDWKAGRRELLMTGEEGNCS